MRQWDVRAFAEDPQTNLWVGTARHGLFCFVNGKSADCRAQAGLETEGIRALLSEADGTLWVGTLNHGLYRLRHGAVRHYSTADGLPNDRLQSLLEDGSGNLWVGSMDGIFSLSKRELDAYDPAHSEPLQSRQLLVPDGLVSRQCSGRGQPTAARTSDGWLWVPNMYAVARFRPETVLRPEPPLPVRLEEVLVDKQFRQPDARGRLRLSSNNGLFEFHYTAMDFCVPESLRFRYKLEGVDEHWVEAGLRRVAYYGRLPAGHYRFRVMATSGAGDWREAANPLELTVVLPLWQRPWVQVMASLAAAILVGASFRAVERVRARRMVRRMQAERALEQERRRIARDIHDDIGASLFSLTLLGEMTERKPLSLEETKRQVGVMTAKARDLGRSMDEIVWAVNPRNDTLPSLVSFLQQFVSEYLEPTPIRCRLDGASELPPVLLRSQARHNLFLAVKEAIHNVADHSGATEVWIRLHWADRVLRISVEDNGRGFDPAKAPCARNGLGNMRSRLEEIGGDCILESQPGQGCRVRFTLPIPNH
jgi:signal transduction histidine kinase